MTREQEIARRQRARAPDEEIARRQRAPAPEAEIARRQRARARIMALLLAAFAVLLFFITIAKTTTNWS